jgi:hypothetical protein
VKPNMFKTQPNHQTSIQPDVPDVPPARSSPFPASLPPRTQPAAGAGNWKDRNCPGIRGFWDFSLSSYSLRTSNKAVLARRICMIAILGSRTAISIIGILYNVFTIHLISLILGVIFGILGFLFVGWCLAKIGEAEGVRVVFGTRVVCFAFLSSF